MCERACVCVCVSGCILGWIESFVSKYYWKVLGLLAFILGFAPVLHYLSWVSNSISELTEYRGKPDVCTPEKQCL